MAQEAVAGQLELQWRAGDRVEPSERPVLTAGPRPDLLHQVQRALVLAPREMTVGAGREGGGARPVVPGDQLRAVNVQGEQHPHRELAEARIALQGLEPRT